MRATYAAAMHGMRPEDIGVVATAGEVRVSPDGRVIVYTLTTQDLDANRARTRLWLVPASGDRRPMPFSAGEGHDVLPRWAPDGSMLAWVETHPDRSPVLCVSPVDAAGQTVRVCTWPDDISEVAWSPSGDRLAFVGRVPDEGIYGPPGTDRKEADMPPRRVTRLLSRLNGDGWVFDRPSQIHVVPLDGSAPPRTLTHGGTAAEGVAWSPDGTRLAFVSARHDTWDVDGCNDLWIADPDGDEDPTCLTDTTESWALPSWSPQGTHLAALVGPTPTDGPRHGQLWTVEVASGQRRRWASSFDRNLAPYGAGRPPLWCGGELLVLAEDHGRTLVWAVSGETVRRVVDGDQVVHSFDVAGPPGSETLAFTATTTTVPVEVFAADGLEGEPRRLSDHSASLRSRTSLVEPERFTARSVGGTEVECWAMAPVGAGPGRPYPTVLNVHGGPFSQYGYGFFDEFQLQAGAGFGVVYCNPRGSSGYSESWARAIRWPEAAVDPGSGWGGVDYQDVMACIEQAAERFEWVDPERIGVQGGSYGGYLTSWIVGHTDRFAAAVSERAVNNLVTLEHGSDVSGLFREYAGWTHLERPDIYARHSPSTYVADMTTPLLLVHSEDDLRCPISQAEELFVALRLAGRRAELVRFPGENHDLSRSGSPRHRVMRAQIILEWFADRFEEK